MIEKFREALEEEDDNNNKKRTKKNLKEKKNCLRDLFLYPSVCVCLKFGSRAIERRWGGGQIKCPSFFFQSFLKVRLVTALLRV